MGYTDEALGEIRKNRERKLAGGFNSIPYGLKRLQHYSPGIQKSNYTIITANSGIGKSKVTKNVFVFRPHDFLIQNPLLKTKLTTLYFCLEETGRAFMQSAMCYRLRKDYNMRVSIKELRSQLDPENPASMLGEDALEKLGDIEKYCKNFEKNVILIDDVRKPYAIYKRCQEFLEEVGDYSLKPVKYFDTAAKEMKTKMGRDQYFTEHEDHYIQIVIDHISLLEPEKAQKDLFEAIRTLSNTYLVQLRNRYHCSIVVVQQQSSEKEKQQYTYKGASIESKLEPSLDGLGDCKLTQRDADEVFGIFAPDRYEISDHRGYDISILRDNYRSLSFLKQRDSETNLRLGVFFDGASNYIAELPQAGDMERKHYDKVLKMTGRDKT